MRVSTSRRALAACGFVAVLAASVTGCSSDSDDDATAATTTTKAAATTTAAAAADPAATKEITDAYVAFFNGTTPPAARAGLVENGATFQPALEAMAADPQASATTATVAKVTTTDATNADVTYTLLMGGNPVLPDQGGQAVKQDGTWKVAAATFCALLSIQGGGGALPPGC
ncbi:hypothetical protein [Rhodococcus sp. NPDC004095]